MVYAVVTFGSPNWNSAESAAKVTGKQKLAKGVYANKQQALSVAHHCQKSGSCSLARVYACESIELAKTADISELRNGERLVM